MIAEADAVTAAADRAEYLCRRRARGQRRMTPPAANSRPLSIYIVAGEESGDALGAALAQALRRACRRRAQLSGVGGRAMAAAGIVQPVPDRRTRPSSV